MDLLQTLVQKVRQPSAVRRWIAGAFFDVFLGEYQIEGMRFIVPRHLTTRQFRSRFLFNEYETDIERIFLHKFLPSSAKVLELGGCIGVMSCVINRILDDPTAHVVVEPHPGLVPSLILNRDQNHCGYHVQEGLLSLSPINEFYIHDLIVGGSACRTTKKMVSTNGYRIRELEEEFGVEFNTLVCDIEGGEYQLLIDLGAEIRRFDWIFLELHDRSDFPNHEDVAKCPEILSSYGFSLIAEDRSSATQQVWVRS
jgi:FkbM family methyltransferase